MQGAGCKVQGARCKVQGARCKVQGAGCRVQGASGGSTALLLLLLLRLDPQLAVRDLVLGRLEEI